MSYSDMTYAWFDVTRNAGIARIMHMSYRSKTYTWNDVILVFFFLILIREVKESNTYTDLGRPLEFLEVEASRISRQSVHEGENVVIPAHRPPLPPGSIPGTHFC
jgi:hypothetical protein